jgi:hypothetical protein
MESLLLLLLFPIVWPFIARQIWNTTITYKEMGLHIALVVVLVATVFWLGRLSSMTDTEILNGEILSKHREHGSYLREYDCFCDKNGCETCHEKRYTVIWYAKSSVGTIEFASLDRSTKRVYKEPDPEIYIRCQPGEPASVESSYTNYVLGVPESLFHEALRKESYPVPEYPKVYDFYLVNRVLKAGTEIDSSVLNQKLNEALKTVGPEKQVNIVVILTEIDDPQYRHYVEQAWIGGKKNDVIIFVGLDGNKITWADVMTWARSSGNEFFVVALRDDLLKIEQYDEAMLAETIISHIKESYVRPQMESYKYLEKEIDPPGWVMMLCGFLAVFGSLGLTYVFQKGKFL